MTLYRRGKVYWSYFYLDGVRHQASTGTGNRREAEAIDQKLKREANLRRHQIELVEFDPDLSFGALAARFIANAGPKPFHLDRLKHLLPYFADVPVARITKGMVRDYRMERRARRQAITEATLNRDVAVIRHLLSAKLLEVLLPIRAPQGLIFTFRGHGIGDYKTAWNRAVKKSLTRHFRFHELRHSFNTRLMEAGVQQEIRKALMGHSSGKDVNAIYTHVELPAKREAIRKTRGVDRNPAQEPRTHRRRRSTCRTRTNSARNERSP
jgi:integrase